MTIMKTQNLMAMALTTALTLTAVALVAWQFRHSAPLTATANGSGPVPGQPASEPAPPRQLPVDNAANDTAVAGDPPVPPTISDYCKNGFTIERDAAGNFQGWLCNAAYDDYSTAALESLAYGDAEAARLLAYRLRHTDYPRAVKMAQRSAALSGGNTNVLVAAASWRPLTRQDGKPDFSGYGQAYVLHQLIARLKDSNYSAPPNFEKRIRELTNEPERVFQELNAIVDRMYDEMRRIELEVTGESTIGGDENV